MRRTHRRTAFAAALAVTLGLTLAACGGNEEPGDDAGAPSSDKEITLYSGRSEKLVQPLIEKFQQATGITVEVRYGNTAQMAAQLLEEGDRSPADIFFAQDAGALGAVAKTGLFAPLPAEVRDKVADVYQAKGGEWVGVTGRSRVLVYNADLAPQNTLPASVFDLTKPEWKGKVGVAPTNASFQAFITAIRVQHGDAKAKEFLDGLAANDPEIREGNGNIVDEVNAGTLPVGLVNHYYIYEKAAEAGVPPDQSKAKLHFFANKDSGALVNVAGVGVLKKAASDPDARAFVDYLLSNEGQTYFAEETFEYPMIAGVPTAPGLPALDSLSVPEVDLNDLDTLDQTIAMITASGLA